MSPSPFHESISEDIVKNYNPPPAQKEKSTKRLLLMVLKLITAATFQNQPPNK